MSEFIKIVNKDDQREIGVIEVKGQSIKQVLSVVFDRGGGPTTNIRFGSVYFGQKRECNAMLVNNGPSPIKFDVFFHPNTREGEVDLDNSDFVCTPYEAGIEMTERIMSCEPQHGVIEAYNQIPVRFICTTKKNEDLKGWRNRMIADPEEDSILSKLNLPDKNKISKEFFSTVAIKFDEMVKEKGNRMLDKKICNPCSVFMEVTAFTPDIFVDKSGINFWNCPVNGYRTSSLKITNRNDEMPVDFSFTKVSF